MPFGGQTPPVNAVRAYCGDLAREQAGVEEGPEPGDEEHHLGGDEHDHAVAQMQRHDLGVVALVAFLDGVRPPGEHGVEHDCQADEEQPRRGDVQPEQVELVALHVLHPGDAADCHDERADGADERPWARVDDVIVVLWFCVSVCVRHISPRDCHRYWLRRPSRPAARRPPACLPRSGRRCRKA